MKNIMAVVFSVAFCANLYAEDGKPALSQLDVGGGMPALAIPVPEGSPDAVRINGALDTPCYLSEEGCKVVSSFYIARKWRLKNDECSRLWYRSRQGIDACERIKEEQGGKGLLDSERDSACSAANSVLPFHPLYVTEEAFLRYHGLERYISSTGPSRPSRPQSTMSCHGTNNCDPDAPLPLPSDPAERAEEIQRLADMSRRNSVESCKRSWFTPAIEVNSDPTGRRDQRYREDLFLPICAQGNGNRNGMRYSGSGQDRYNMALEFVCTRKPDGMWTTDSMKLRIDQPTTVTQTTTEGSSQGWNVSANLTIIEKVLGVTMGYSETIMRSTSYGTGTSQPYGSWVPLTADNLACGSEIDVSGTCSH